MDLKKLIDNAKDGKYAKMFSEFGTAFKTEMRQLEKKPPKVSVKSLGKAAAAEGMIFYEAKIAASDREKLCIISGTPCALVPDSSIESYDVTVQDMTEEGILLRSASEIPEGERDMTLHIGEKIIVRELARFLVERKKRDCPAGEAMFAKKGMEPAERICYDLFDDGRFEETAEIAYNFLKKGKKVLYLSDSNSACDKAMRSAAAKCAADDENISLLRYGFSADPDMPADLVLSTHARRVDPASYDKMKELEGELLAEDIESLEEMIEGRRLAEEEIRAKKRVISSMEKMIRDSEEKKKNYREKNVLKRMMVRDFESDVDISISRAKNKMEAAKETIEENRKYIEEVDGSIKFFDKEKELLDLRRRVASSQIEALKRADMAGAVMSTVYLYNDLEKFDADVLIIDEASRIWIPALWAAGYLVKGKVVLVGENDSAPQAALTKGGFVDRWLKTSIFSYGKQ